MPKANVDHTISGQGTAISTLDHSSTPPKGSKVMSLVKQIYDNEKDVMWGMMGRGYVIGAKWKVHVLCYSL